MRCGNTALEIVDLYGRENNTCTREMRKGWNARSECLCDIHTRFANCTGEG